MKGKKPLTMLLRGFIIVILVVLVVVLVVAGIGWWAGWTEIADFQRAIQMAGLLVMGLGLLGIKGNLDMSRSFEYQYSMTVSGDESWERIQQTLVDLAQSYSFMLIMGVSGCVCLVIGWLM